ncbi:hypothetical protein CACET_c31300 [Clostridium aceticum]|uniref:Uncharacterized protein n=1 Tax=Clostridium aceticum TaxID=84022 RepID=A0A0D8IAF4_9CLOT|nr:hypothetical protein [Clostridium aceticum]AKL96574.1 hypothetical protein CACET_c31300 [Clostridium aceticum]KJF27270.1 hypothetical protein TZ02_07945 [Clostridium aceticum]
MNPENSSIKSKLALDLFGIQMQWSLWYIPVVLIIHFIVLRFVPDVEERDLNLIYFVFQPSKIYMLIIAILSCFSLMGYAVKNGITRRDYFWGSAVAAVGVAFSIMILAAILAGVLELFGLFTAYSSVTNSIAFLDTSSIWIVPVLVLSLILLCYYIAGWIIAVGFYRFGGLVGIGFVAIALLFVSIADLLWEGELSHPLAVSLDIPFANPSIPFSITATLILIGLGLWLVRILTKRIPIKVE